MKALVSRIIQLEASVNSHEINSYSGDSLLVSTPPVQQPLSAGGPIVDRVWNAASYAIVFIECRSNIINCNDIIEIEIMYFKPGTLL